MSIKTKLSLNLNAFLVLASYMTVEWYEAAISNWLSLGPMPM